jgi:hypothetical protein
MSFALDAFTVSVQAICPTLRSLRSEAVTRSAGS